MNEIAQLRFKTFAAMTLVAIVLYYQADWRFMVPLYSLAAAGFTLNPKWTLTNWGFWSVVTAVLLAHLLAHLVLTWPQEGNNYYLYFYASLTVLVGCLTNSLTAVMTNARLLIGLVFAFAATWKMASGSYISGDFFQHFLLVEPRTHQLAKWVFPSWSTSYNFSHSNLVVVTQVLTWAGLLLELLIAAAFLLSLPGLSRIRNILLFAFMLFAYALLPVPAFGMTLATLGYIQSKGLSKCIYLASFILMPLTTLRTFLD